MVVIPSSITIALTFCDKLVDLLVSLLYSNYRMYQVTKYSICSKNIIELILTYIGTIDVMIVYNFIISIGYV